MPKGIILVDYTDQGRRSIKDSPDRAEAAKAEAAKRLVEDGGTKRAAAVQALLKQQEARLENMYFSSQNDGPDVFAIVEVPEGGADVLGVIALAGRTAGITLTARRIYTPEELDKLAAKSMPTDTGKISLASPIFLGGTDWLSGRFRDSPKARLGLNIRLRHEHGESLLR